MLQKFLKTIDIIGIKFYMYLGESLKNSLFRYINNIYM